MGSSIGSKADQLQWKRAGSDWVLLCQRRRMGRVVPDAKHPGMYRIALSRGRLSDMANLSWAKNAALVAAEHELDWEARHAAATNPAKRPVNGGLFSETSSSVRFGAANECRHHKPGNANGELFI